MPHSAAATYSAVFGAAVRAIAAADARAAVVRDLLARFAPTVARLTHDADSSTLPLPEPALVHMLRLLSAAALHLHDDVAPFWAQLWQVATAALHIDQPVAVTRAAGTLMHALLSTCVVPMLAEVESLQTDAERAEHWRHWGRHDEVSLRWIAAADSTVLLATAAADAVLAEATALLSAAQPLNQKSARFLVRRLLALATAFSGPMPASDDGDVDRASLVLSYAQPSAAAPLVAARVRVHERCTALTATLYERLQAELADDIVTQQRAVALASVLLASRSTRSAAPSRASPCRRFRAASRRSSAATRTRGAGRALPSLRRRCARTR